MLSKDLFCYKNIQLDSANKLKFFLEKHSTKEGTWALLKLESGIINFIFLNGAGEELATHRLDNNNPEILIPPSSWHKIQEVNEFTANLGFFCLEHRYFNKKYNLAKTSNELLYVLNTYFKDAKELKILNLANEQIENALFMAFKNLKVANIQAQEPPKNKLLEIINKEKITNLENINFIEAESALRKNYYDFVVSLDFFNYLTSKNTDDFLQKLQATTKIGGINLLIFPIQNESHPLPTSFTYLAQTKELYQFYQDNGWAILEYNETLQQFNNAYGVFGFLLAQKHY